MPRLVIPSLSRRLPSAAVGLLVAASVAAILAASAAALPLRAQSAKLGPAPAPIADADYVARRDSLLAHIDSGIVVVPGAREPVEHYPSFRQHPAFRYLTGFLSRTPRWCW